MADTITIAPTWTGVVQLLIAGIENGTPEGRSLAITELKRMAAIADSAVASQPQPTSRS